MEAEKVIEILEVEKKCVTRASKNKCNRNCEVCDLVRPSEEILEAYTEVISILKNHLTS